MKTCKLCTEEKPLTEFYSQNKVKADGTKYIYHIPECKECTKKKSVDWYTENPEKFKGIRRKYSAKSETKEMVKGYNKIYRGNGKSLEWQRNNKDKLVNYRLSRANKQHQISRIEWLNCKSYFNNECAYCGLYLGKHFNKFKGRLIWTDFHKEHVEHEGLNDITNCVPSCKVCNSSKHISKLEDWYNENNEHYTEERLIKIYKWLDTFNIE